MVKQNKEWQKQLGFYFDQNRCTGCSACVVACKDWHDIQAGPINWIRVHRIEEGKFPNPYLGFLFNPCYHCIDPPCITVCPASAILKREEDGIVIVDNAKCQEDSRCGISSFEITGLSLSYGEGKSPCQLACPIQVSVPGYLALIAKGRFREALDLIRQALPLPSVCGRVCFAPCEKECRRQEVDDSVAIAALKRFITEHVFEDLPFPLPQTNQGKIAIIGSGPAGLSAAYDLIRKGYGVTIYESSSVAGGMLAMGIPAYRLPREVLKRDIDYIVGLGVRIVTNTPLGPELTLDDLIGQGYGAILIATGAQEGTKLKIPGADLKNTLLATSFLHDINLGKKIPIEGKVIVFGGGNVAIDTARVAARLGASEVHVVCLEHRHNMPAVTGEIKGAEEEGIIIHDSVIITKILGSESKVIGVECLKLRSVEFDENGQPHVDLIKGTEHVLLADLVIFAVGQKPNLSFIDTSRAIEVSNRRTIVVNPITLATSRQGIFACGDVINGPTNVIEAIASGKKAAYCIDQYLRGYIMKARQTEDLKPSNIKVIIPADIKKEHKQQIACLPAADRVRNFEEVILGYGEEMAMTEAKRCLNCTGHLCKEVCPYSVPQFAFEANTKMQKCNFCLDRWIDHKKPICVSACPMRALDAGPLEEIKSKYGDTKEAEGFAYSLGCKPSIIFRPKKYSMEEKKN